MKKLLLLVLLTACGRTPTAPEAKRVPRCIESVRWQKYYMTDSLGVSRIDSVRLVTALGCG